MDSNEIYTEAQEREGREAEAQDRDARGDEGSKEIDLMGWQFGFAPEAEYVSKERVIVSYPNGYDDQDAEIEDESECEL